MGKRSNSGITNNSSGSNSPLSNGAAKRIHTYYSRSGGYYGDETLDASFDASSGTLNLSKAANKSWAETTGSRNYVDITVKNGFIDGEPVNVDINNSSIKYVTGIDNGSIKSATRDFLIDKGFGYNSYDKRWERNYKGYTKQGNTLHVDSKLPDSFAGITQVKTPYGIDTRPLKQAGFKWNRERKLWVK